MQIPPPTYRSLAVVLLLLGLLTSGCDNTVDPFAGETDEAYAVFGFLDSGADTQFVRVTPIRGTLETSADPIDAVVTLRDLETGTAATWTDSLVQLEGDTTAHLFYSTAPVHSGRTYRLEVARSDGATTRAVTRLPEAPAAEVEAPVSLADSTVFTQRIHWHDIGRHPDEARVYYEVSRSATAPKQDAVVDYTLRGSLLAGTWSSSVLLSRDQGTVRTQIDVAPGDEENVVFYGVYMEIEVWSEEWEEREENAKDDIENGRGFFASISRPSFRWKVPGYVVDSLGYVDAQMQAHIEEDRVE